MEMGLLSGLMQLAGMPGWRRFEQAVADPDRAQREAWERISRKCQGSPYWTARWGPKGAPPLAELPLTEYDDYEAAFDAAFDGDRSPTTGETIAFWITTSGSTATRLKTPKRFPVSSDGHQQSFAAGKTCYYSMAVAVPDIPLKPVLPPYAVGGWAPSPAGVPVYQATGSMISHLSGFQQPGNVFPPALVARPDLWDEWAPLYAAASDVSMAVTISADRIALLCQDLVAGIDRYWPYLEGRAAPPSPLPRVQTSTERLLHLRSVFAGAPPGLRRIWPSLKLVSCWTTASVGAAVPLLEPWLEGVRLLDAPYSSGETGPATVPLHDGEEGHPLNPDLNVLELLPEGAAPEPGNVIPASQAEAGRRYELIVTTPVGLVRYRMRDIVACTGFHGRTPRLAFRCKTGFCVNVSETVSFPEDAVVKLLLDHGYRLQDDLMLGPHPTGKSLVMYTREGAGHPLAGRAFDDALCEFSGDYAAKRKQGLLRVIHNMVTPASHPMWARPFPAKARYVLPKAPDDLE